MQAKEFEPWLEVVEQIAVVAQRARRALLAARHRDNFDWSKTQFDKK